MVVLWFAVVRASSGACASHGELLDGFVVVGGGQRLQRAPVVSVELDDLHQERARQLRLRRTQHLIPHGRQQLRHHFRKLLLQ